MKKILLLAALLLPLGLFVAGCVSTDPVEKETTPDITLEVLERKMIRARDPQGLFRQARTYLQRQVIRVGRAAYLMEVRYQAPDCFKITTIRDNAPESAIILNGNSGWSVDYKQQAVTPIVGESLFQLKTLYNISNPAESYQHLFRQVELSLVLIDGEEFYKMICTAKLENNPQLILYIGKDSYLLRRISIPSLKYSSIISGYSLYEGVMIPQETVIAVDQRRTTAKIIENLLNIPFDQSEFLPPVFAPKRSSSSAAE